MSARRPLPKWADVALLPALNLILAFVVGGLVVIFIGQNPFEAVAVMLEGAFGTGEGLGYTLYYASNFVFAGIAFSIAAHAGLFNIGAEGQAYVAGIGAILAGFWFGNTHWLIVMGAGIIMAGAFGAAWGFIPGYLQAKRGSHVVITTIMFNFIASALMVYLLNRVLKKPGQMAPESEQIAVTGRIPQLREFFDFFGFSPVNITILVAVVALIGFYILMWRTELGYKLRALGHNPSAAHYAGMSNSRLIIIAMLISGGVAGMMAVNQVLSVQYRLVLDFVSGYGFIGIAVGLMGRNHPVGIALAAILFGALYQGGQHLAFWMQEVPREMVVVIQALVILFTGAMEGLFRVPLENFFTWLHLRRQAPAKSEEAEA